jgi:sec-independent protein translocase protein TatC
MMCKYIWGLPLSPLASQRFKIMRRLLARLWHFVTTPFRWVLRPFHSFFLEEPEDTPLGETVQKAIANPGDVLAHLAALRGHLFRAVLVLALAAAVTFNYSQAILNWLALPVGGIEKLQAIDVTEPVGTVMRVTFFSAFAIALPYIAFELLLFVAPGLSRRARVFGLIALPLVFLFFVLGILFTYYVLLPPAINFLVNFRGIPTLIRPSSYISFSTGLMLWVGIAFEFPLLSYVLASMGLLPASWLSTNWRLAVVGLAILAAAITPTIDPINMMLVWIPLTALYFLSIGTASLAQRQRAARLAK